MNFIVKNNRSGFAAISMLLFLSFMSLFLTITYLVVTKSLQGNINISRKLIATTQANLSIDDAYSFYKSNKGEFYDPNNTSPCYTIGSISSYSNFGIDEFILSETLKTTGSPGIIGNENLKDDTGFINRTCSIYSQGLPNKTDADFSIQGKGSDIDTSFKGIPDQEGFYNIKYIYNNGGFGFFFTREQIGESEISINLDYNFSEFGGIEALNIFEKDLSDKILLLKKNDSNISVTKTNLSNLLSKTMNIYDDAYLEIGILSFNGSFSIDDGFQIQLDTGEVVKGSHIDGVINKGTQQGRLLCNKDNQNCSISNINLEGNKIYFLYLKSFDKATSFHMDLFNTTGDSVSIPTSLLTVKTYGIADGVLHKREKSIDTGNNNGFYSEFSSQIYNYVYFSRN